MGGWAVIFWTRSWSLKNDDDKPPHIHKTHERTYLHGRVDDGREHEADAGGLDALGHLLCAELHVDAQGLQDVRGACMCVSFGC